jgi:hypothetical protein
VTQDDVIPAKKKIRKPIVAPKESPAGSLRIDTESPLNQELELSRDQLLPEIGEFVDILESKNRRLQKVKTRLDPHS